MSLLEFVDKWPPFLCRLCARKARGHKRLTCREIAKAGGLSKSQVSEIAVKTSWRGVPIEMIDKFSKGCGVSHFKLKKHKRFMKRSKWAMQRDRRAMKYHYRLLSLG